MVSQPLSQTPENTHQAVLHLLKRHNELTVADLCEELGITSMAVRRHLVGLQREGLVDCRLVRQSRGRPTYKYRLTSKAESLFPSGLTNMAFDLLGAVYETQGNEGVMELLATRDAWLIKKHKPRLERLSINERIKEVVKIYSENGFMTEWEELSDGNYFIFQKHCAIHHLATQYQQLCILEPQLMAQLLGVKVTREKFMLKEDPVCGYLVHSNNELSTAT